MVKKLVRRKEKMEAQKSLDFFTISRWKLISIIVERMFLYLKDDRKTQIKVWYNDIFELFGGLDLFEKDTGKIRNIYREETAFMPIENELNNYII